MATFSLFLDKRGLKDTQPAPLKVVIRAHNKSVMISLGISLLPNQWDARNLKVVNHPRRIPLTTIITQKRLDFETAFVKVSSGHNSLSADEIRRAVLDELNPSSIDNRPRFKAQYIAYMDSKKGRTAEIYKATENRIIAYCGDELYENLTFDDITPKWLREFDDFLSKTSPSANARGIHMRNIRAVFNNAMDNDLITTYPFRKFKIRSVKTIKRSLSVDDLRRLFAYPDSDYSVKYLDVFKLIFMLIGINIVDLCSLKSINNGRVEYYRSKTKKLYSIKVEPEAEAIIKQYIGTDWLLDIRDRYVDYRGYARKLNDALRYISKKLGLPVITTYWARHSWATIAASLDIPKETIAAALGHELGNKMTSIYIDFDQKKVDDANRKVLDWVLYSKR